jgi:predicted amidohydrolase
MRKVRIATVSFLMEDIPHTVEMNLDRAKAYIQEASESGADIVCLPETVTTNRVANPQTYAPQCREWDKHFASCAKEFALTVIAPFYVQYDDKSFNQATVFRADGEIAGCYAKTQPTGREAQWITPGSEFPIIDIGIAKIAIMTCMDIYFPEIARIYAMKGAEILFWPTITHGPTQSGLEAQLKSRAIDNSLHIVEANLSGHPPYAPYKGRFYPGNARIVDFNGDILAQTGRRAGLAIADIDLDEQRRTTDVLLIRDDDDTRADLESLARLDLYAKEYGDLASRQKRYYDTIKK